MKWVLWKRLTKHRFLTVWKWQNVNILRIPCISVQWLYPCGVSHRLAWGEHFFLTLNLFPRNMSRLTNHSTYKNKCINTWKRKILQVPYFNNLSWKVSECFLCQSMGSSQRCYAVATKQSGSNFMAVRQTTLANFRISFLLWFNPIKQF